MTETKAIKTLSPGARVTLALYYMLTRETKTPKTEAFIQFLFERGIKSTDDIATPEIVEELLNSGCIDEKGLSGLGAAWAKFFGTERQLPNEFKLPKDLKKGLNNMPSAIMADLAKQILITLAHRASDESRLDQIASEKLFNQFIKRFEDLDLPLWAAEY